jgi:hypothetical protein
MTVQLACIYSVQHCGTHLGDGEGDVHVGADLGRDGAVVEPVAGVDRVVNQLGLFDFKREYKGI